MACSCSKEDFGGTILVVGRCNYGSQLLGIARRRGGPQPPQPKTPVTSEVMAIQEAVPEQPPETHVSACTGNSLLNSLSACTELNQASELILTGPVLSAAECAATGSSSNIRRQKTEAIIQLNFSRSENNSIVSKQCTNSFQLWIRRCREARGRDNIEVRISRGNVKSGAIASSSLQRSTCSSEIPWGWPLSCGLRVLSFPRAFEEVREDEYLSLFGRPLQKHIVE